MVILFIISPLLQYFKMKTGKSINRPVQARHLELAARRRDYKIHLSKLNPQKGGTYILTVNSTD